ncbi:MAG TPA: hypothetical protein PKH39_13645 [Woeseiaceae bacterium]|nr:hypothetical protein [Woeseiaceae bacterium]
MSSCLPKLTQSATTTVCASLLGLACSATVYPIAAVAQSTETVSESKQSARMSDELRASVSKVVVLPGRSPARGSVTGSYQKETDDFFSGADKGRRIGDGVSTDIGGVTVRYPIPILTYPGLLLGGLSGGAKGRIQDFRDALTDDLAQSASDPLSNDALASDVFWSIRNVPSLKPKVLALTTPIPADTEAVLYVEMTGVDINADADTATITTTAQATLRRMSDGVHIYETEVSYQDTDSLSNWTKDDLSAWRAYSNYARHYIGREISARVFERIELDHELKPLPSDDVSLNRRDKWRGTTQSSTPTLSWELTLSGDDAMSEYAGNIDRSAIQYDVEVYDSHQMVYYARRLDNNSHTVELALEPCKTYRWTVRPIYPMGDDLRYGEWMRFDSDTIGGRGNLGLAASTAAAYIQDFVSLEVKCRRR